jgi:hypothetical protein
MRHGVGFQAAEGIIAPKTTDQTPMTRWRI